MVSRGADSIVLWPQYFDRDLSRDEGRRVPSALAVREPDAQWIEAACRKLGLEAELEDDARHPSSPYVKSGRVLVAKGTPKEAVIRQVGARMHESQAAREAERDSGGRRTRRNR